MKEYRITFTETEPFMGNMVDRQHGTKWMTREEAETSKYRFYNNAKLVKRGET